MNGDANAPNAGQSVFSRPPRAQSTPGPAARHAVAARSSATPSASVPDTQRPGISMPDAERRALEAQRRRGANWFYWMIVVFGILGERAVAGYRWAFVLGMVLYALDGCLFLLVRDWPALGFHVFALVMIGRGYVAARRLPSP